jgi:hypothetical protein
MTPEEQLKEWVKGNSIHMTNPDMCCPDFSCCEPELLASKEERKIYSSGNDEVRMNMLLIFLEALLIKKGWSIEEAEFYPVKKGNA